MIRILATTFAGLLGLAFGSFLNVCVSRWPAGESVVTPRSHCRNCGRTLTWWENVPVLSWLALRGKCRTCGVRIGIRYVLVEAAVGATWAFLTWRSIPVFLVAAIPTQVIASELGGSAAVAILDYLLIGLAALDAEYFWLPDVITYPGIALGVVASVAFEAFGVHFDTVRRPFHALLASAEAAIAGIALILLIWGLYWLIRRKEGIGLGDAKLMAMLGAWLGFSGVILSFGIGVVLGAVAAVWMLLRGRAGNESWAAGKLPLGTFLCIGGIISSLWGQQIVAAYLRWAGF
jgi:leader peptidase (prepilin peptidase)/N-methyltransferase